MLEKLYPFRWQILFLLLGALFVSAAIFIQNADLLSSPSIEVIDDANDIGKDGEEEGKVIVEISGSVNSPGVYTLAVGSRIEDALVVAGGLVEGADVQWIEKYINRAAIVSDGQKIYFPSQSEALSDSGSVGGNIPTNEVLGQQTDKVNINTASQSELESLWGIGPVTAQNIIDQRMYSSPDELLTKGVLKKNVYEKNKDILAVY